jgi:hypothetical protein
MTTGNNVLAFPPVRETPQSKHFSFDVISQETVNGKVLVEGCIPASALPKILAILEAAEA